MRAHEIEYKLYGDDMQFVEIELDPEESVIAEAGAMMMMEDYIEMETIFGDGSGPSGGLFGKLMGAGKRLVTRRKYVYDCIYKYRSRQTPRLISLLLILVKLFL